MNKYKLYCTFHGWVEVISSDLPTKCPIIQTDTIKVDSIVVIEEDIFINDGTPTELILSEYKELRYHEIDQRTGELISQGFTYQSKVFSLSANAQTNILALDNSRDDPALIYPINYNTIDDLDSYDVVDSNDLHSMYLTALQTKKGHVDSGTVLKDTIRNAVDQQAVDLIIDAR